MASQGKKSLRNQDMTEGSIMKKLLLFAVPVLCSTLFSQLYNLVDSIVVGRFVSSNALAAVGCTGNVIMVFHFLMVGLHTGAGVIVSQYFGAKKYDELNKSVITLIMLSGYIVIGMLVVGIPLSTVFLNMLHTPEVLLKDATTYMRINLCGMIGQVFYFCGGHILRGMGDSKTPSFMVILCSGINIVLDLLFVVVFHWGVAGVAWATAIAQFISAVVVMYRLSKYDCLDFSKGNWHVDTSKIRPILSIGIPSAIQQLCLSLGNLIIQRFSNGFGPDFLAAMAAVTKVDTFALMPLNSLGQALTTFVGQNVGANKPDRVKKGVRDTTITILVAAVLLGVIMILFGKNLMHIFTTEPAVIEMGKVCITIMAVSYWGMALQQSYSGLLRGAGVALVPAIIMIAALALRIPFTYLLAVRPDDYRGIFYCLAGANTLGGVGMWVYYRSGIWQKHNAIKLGSR